MRLVVGPWSTSVPVVNPKFVLFVFIVCVFNAIVLFGGLCFPKSFLCSRPLGLASLNSLGKHGRSNDP